MRTIGPVAAVIAFALVMSALSVAAARGEEGLDLKSLAGADAEQIKAFFASGDYLNRQRSDEQFIQDVYQGVLQRPGDEAGVRQWAAAMKGMSRTDVVEKFLASSEYLDKHRPDTTRNPANVLFDRTGMFVNDASQLPASQYAAKMKMGEVAWISLQIDNGGGVRGDNALAVEKGWADQWRKAGFKVGFWGCPRGVREHGKQSAVDEARPWVEADAALAVQLSAKYHADFYLADVEDSYQGYSQSDPAPLVNGIYVEAFKRAAAAAGIAKMPRAMSSMGRVALDMKVWIDEGWDAMPQAYWNMYSHYQPSRCVDFYMQTGWPIGRIHPTIGTFTSEGEKRTVSLEEYDKDLRSRATRGFSFYLPESYLHEEGQYRFVARMGQRGGGR